MDQIDPAYSLPFGDKYGAHFEHCGGLITDNAYQVTSEEAGIIPLDMIVGSRCLMEAKSLQPSCGGNQSYGPNKLQLDTKESPFAIQNLISTLETRAR
jgi:hypothetical protein